MESWKRVALFGIRSFELPKITNFGKAFHGLNKTHGCERFVVEMDPPVAANKLNSRVSALSN